MHLDPKALEAAVTASTNAMIRNEPDVEAAIRTYLSASLPADTAELVERLDGVYRIPITDGLGPVGGEEPDNPNEFVRTFETPPIQKEAASLIQSQAARIAEASWELEAALLSADPYPYVRKAARALLNRRADG